MSTYTIKYSDGRRATADTYEEAVDALHAELGENAVIGHDGDLTEGGDRTLAWTSEEEAEDDAGAHAAAGIYGPAVELGEAPRLRRWTTTTDARNEIDSLMGAESTPEIAAAVVAELRRTEVIRHDGRDFVADLEPVDLWAVADRLGL